MPLAPRGAGAPRPKGPSLLKTLIGSESDPGYFGFSNPNDPEYFGVSNPKGVIPSDPAPLPQRRPQTNPQADSQNDPQPDPQKAGILRRLFQLGLVGMGGALGYSALTGPDAAQVSRDNATEQQLMSILMGVPDQIGQNALHMQDLAMASRLMGADQPMKHRRLKNVKFSPELADMLSEYDTRRIMNARMTMKQTLAEALAAEGLY